MPELHDQPPKTSPDQPPNPPAETAPREHWSIRERDQAHRLFEKGVHVTAVTLVQRPASELYAAWRELENLPRFIDDLVRIDCVDDTTSRWTADAAFNGTTTVQWTAQIINDRPGEVLAWKTVPGSEIELAGSVRFRELPHARGSEVRIALEYVPPIGFVAEAIAKAFTGDANSRVRAALHRFRQVMETGEVAISRGQPAGESRWRTDRPGQQLRKTDADVRDIADPGSVSAAAVAQVQP